MNERVVRFASELLTALAARDDLSKVMVAVNQEEGVVTAFANQESCGRLAMYTIDFRDVCTLVDAHPTIVRMMNQVELQLAGKPIVDDCLSSIDHPTYGPCPHGKE